MDSLISIIVPVYNVEDYIEECILSICNQTYENIEILIVNDGSSDNSLQKCANLAKRDNRIKIFNKENGGLSSARNHGLNHAQGDYIAFIDSDDIIPRNYLSVHYSNFCNYQIDVSICEIRAFTVKDKYRPYRSLKSRLYSSKSIIKSLLCQRADNSSCNKLYKASVIGSLRFKEGIINEDFPFITQLFTTIKSVFYTKETFYAYRMREGSITNNTIKPNIIDFVNNAYNAFSYLGKEFAPYLRAYYYSEIINFIYKVNKANAKDLFTGKILEYQKILSNSFSILLNPYLHSKIKIKYLILKYKNQI